TVVVIAVAASHLRRGHETEVFTAAVRIALPILVVGVLLAFVAGDRLCRLLVLAVLFPCSAASRLAAILIEHQPMKMAAAEALLDTEQPAAFSLFATWPLTCTPETKNRELKIPHVLSVLATHSWSGGVTGVHQAQQAEIARYGPGNYTPCVPAIYLSCLVMVYGFGLLLGLAALLGWLLFRGRMADSPRLMKFAAWAWPLPFLIN